MSRLRDSIFILRKKQVFFFSRFFFKFIYEFQSSKTFFSDQGMIENSYLKSHIFTKKNWYFFHNFDENSNKDIIIILLLSKY